MVDASCHDRVRRLVCQPRYQALVCNIWANRDLKYFQRDILVMRMSFVIGVKFFDTRMALRRAGLATRPRLLVEFDSGNKTYGGVSIFSAPDRISNRIIFRTRNRSANSTEDLAIGTA
jgi:hypothetical protein